MVVTKVKSKTKKHSKKHSKKFSKNGKNKSMKRNLSRKGRNMRGGSNYGLQRYHQLVNMGKVLSKVEQQRFNRQVRANLAKPNQRTPAGEVYLNRGSQYGSRGLRFRAPYNSSSGSGYYRSR